jgi:predicted enzyme related to lactoylglutathione lyase
MSNETADRGRIIGIGGVFFKSAGHESLRAWYKDTLGIASGDAGAMFKWRAHDCPDREHLTAWCIFPGTSKYFDPSTAPLMINYLVDDMDAFLAKIPKTGPNAEIKREDHEYGRFAWIFDPDGNKIELWEAPKA